MDIATVKYLGDLRVAAVHRKSNEQIKTDAPTDNNGKGESFSPTDLAAVSLATCMLTVMGIAAQKNGIPFSEVTASVKKHMASSPRKIQKIEVEIQMKDEQYTLRQKSLLEKTARNCPVAKSLHPELTQEVQFIYKK